MWWAGTGSNRRPCGFQPGEAHPDRSAIIRVSHIRAAQQGEAEVVIPGGSGFVRLGADRFGRTLAKSQRSARPTCRNTVDSADSRGPARSQWTGRRCRCRTGPVNARTSIHSKLATNANVTRIDRIIPRSLPLVPSAPSLPGIAGGQPRLHLGWACAPRLGRCRISADADRLSSRVSPSGPLTSSVRETIRVIA